MNRWRGQSSSNTQTARMMVANDMDRTQTYIDQKRQKEQQYFKDMSRKTMTELERVVSRFAVVPFGLASHPTGIIVNPIGSDRPYFFLAEGNKEAMKSYYQAYPLLSIGAVDSATEELGKGRQKFYGLENKTNPTEVFGRKKWLRPVALLKKQANGNAEYTQEPGFRQVSSREFTIKYQNQMHEAASQVWGMMDGQTNVMASPFVQTFPSQAQRSIAKLITQCVAVALLISFHHEGDRRDAHTYVEAMMNASSYDLAADLIQVETDTDNAAMLRAAFGFANCAPNGAGWGYLTNSYTAAHFTLLQFNQRGSLGAMFLAIVQQHGQSPPAADARNAMSNFIAGGAERGEVPTILDPEGGFLQPASDAIMAMHNFLAGVVADLNIQLGNSVGDPNPFGGRLFMPLSEFFANNFPPDVPIGGMIQRTSDLRPRMSGGGHVQGQRVTQRNPQQFLSDEEH
jgi:hypothetical protein